MAIYEHGLLGSFKGKIGGQIGANWRGINYMRSLANRPRKPASEKQLAQRLKFSMATAFLNPMRELIRILPDGKARARKTDFNEATSIVLKSMEGYYPDFVIRYDAVVLTRGLLMGILPNIETDNQEEIRISWSSRLGQGASNDDEVQIVVYNESIEEYALIGSRRSAGECSILVDETGKGSLHIWTFVKSSDGSICSNSRYYGMIELQ